jgi:hypothetical protein
MATLAMPVCWSASVHQTIIPHRNGKLDSRLRHSIHDSHVPCHALTAAAAAAGVPLLLLLLLLLLLGW